MLHFNAFLDSFHSIFITWKDLVRLSIVTSLPLCIPGFFPRNRSTLWFFRLFASPQVYHLKVHLFSSGGKVRSSPEAMSSVWSQTHWNSCFLSSSAPPSNLPSVYFTVDFDGSFNPKLNSLPFVFREGLILQSSKLLREQISIPSFRFSTEGKKTT